MQETADATVRQPNGSMDELLRQTGGLIEKYGHSIFSEKKNIFLQKVDQMSVLNTRFFSLVGESDPNYAHTVQEIVTITQEYYTFIGGLPEDMRSLFMKLLETAGTQLGIENLEKSGVDRISTEKNPLLTVQSIRPQKYIMQIDAISNQLASLGETTSLRVGTKSNKPVKTTVTLDMPDHMRIDGGALSTYDKSIINGVTSLLESGNTVFSVPMLYHAMTGKQNPTVDEQLSDEVSAKIEKMRRMILSIDLEEENAARQFTDQNGEVVDVCDVSIEGYLLPLNKIIGTVNGKKTELYQIIQNPPLYTYSKMKRQLASVPISLLNAPINNNSTTIPLKTYLLQRIELMKNPRNSIRSTRILYDSIYEELCAQDAGKTRKMRIRSYTTIILDYFIQCGYIRKYSEFQKGRSIGGVDVRI